MIGIIDYRMGNLRSVQKAFERVGSKAVILSSPGDAAGVAKLVLPGVGAFADGMAQLVETDWTAPIRDFIASGKPFLGICLGMQLLFESSEEDAPSPDQPVPGLAVLPGRVVRFAGGLRAGDRRLKVPQMGWNALTWRREDPLLHGLAQDDAVYFVHSYYVQPDPALTSAVTDYGGPICASVWRDNVWATQFHPEKSQRVGLTMLGNFAAF